jgi:hypothetical protein
MILSIGTTLDGTRHPGMPTDGCDDRKSRDGRDSGQSGDKINCIGVRLRSWYEDPDRNA